MGIVSAVPIVIIYFQGGGGLDMLCEDGVFLLIDSEIIVLFPWNTGFY